MKNLLDQSIEKSRSGVYQDTSENRRKHRVGQHYGDPKKPEEEGEEKKSKREQRIERLLSYKQNLHTIEEALKRGMVSEDKKEKVETLKASLEEKISKLESKLKIKKDEASKTEPKKEEAKKEGIPHYIGPVWRGKDGVSVEEMAKDKKPEFVKRGKIDPTSDPDWQKKAESIDWDKIDLADMGQTIEYLGKIGQFEDGSDMYGIRYYSPNGKKSSVTAVGKKDYLRNVQREGFNVRESMRTAVDYLDPDATESTREIAKMVLESKTPAEIHDYVASTHTGIAEGTINRIIKRGYMEAEAAQIRMENAVNGVQVPTYEKDESDPIPDSVKKLNSRSDTETINKEIVKYLGLEPDPSSYYGVKSEDVGKIREFWESDWRGKGGLSKIAVIDKLKAGYKNRLVDKNRKAEEASMLAYYESPEGKARVAAYEKKGHDIYEEAKNAAKISADKIKDSLKKTGYEIKKVNVYSDGSARIYLEGGGQYGDVNVSYRSQFDETERQYEVDVHGFGSVKPGTIEAKVVGLVGKMLTDENLINSIKGALEKTVSADSIFERKSDLLKTEFEDLMLESEKKNRLMRGTFVSKYLKGKSE